MNEIMICNGFGYMGIILFMNADDSFLWLFVLWIFSYTWIRMEYMYVCMVHS